MRRASAFSQLQGRVRCMRQYEKITEGVRPPSEREEDEGLGSDPRRLPK